MDAAGFSTNDLFGYSVSISGDGATAVVGAYNDNGGDGGVFVFVRAGTTWSGIVTGTPLTPSGPYAPSSGEALGTSVSISTDGSTIAG